MPPKIARHYAPAVPKRDSKEDAPKRTKICQWVPTDDDQLAKAEARFIAPLSDRVNQRFIAGINTLSEVHHSPEEPSKRIAVLVHGFGGASGHWLRNWDAFAPNVDSVHAIDLPGFARSIREKREFADCDDVISYYEEYFMNWLAQLPEYREGTTAIDIIGHSFGAFLVGSIAARRPHLFEHVVLCDPWGVQTEDEEKLKDIPLRWRFALWLGYNVVSPISILKAMGGRGPKVLPKARPDFAPRWSNFHGGDPYVFYDYTYHCNANGRSTGADAFLAATTKRGPPVAQRPLEKSLPEAFPPTMRVSVIYGEWTWMDMDAGDRMVNALRAKGCDVNHAVVEEAGHQVMTDNPDAFNIVAAKLLYGEEAAAAMKTKISLTKSSSEDNILSGGESPINDN